MSSKTKIICVVGPTASGKTALGIEIALKYGGEVISADSMQIYRGLEIASAAPRIEEMRGVPHHLIGFLPPEVQFSAADYVNAARDKISEINGRGALPVIVGGTGLYISALTENIIFTEQKSNPELRSRLTERLEQTGAEAMLRELAEFDPDSAARLNPGNKRRIIRAFEVYYETGVTMTEQLKHSRETESPYEPIMIGITFADREKLYSRINTRVDIMLENGLEKEARLSYDAGYNAGAAQAIGHKELYDWFSGNTDYASAVDALKRRTRNYAKRQLTWFGRDNRIHWIYADRTENVAQSAFEIIEGGADN